MTPTKFIDEIDRLFDELVRDRWRAPRPALPPPRADETELEVAVPAEEQHAHDVSVSIDGGQLTVTVQHAQAGRAEVGGARLASAVERSFRRTFAVPAGASLRAVETRMAEGALRIRVRLGVPR